MVIPGSDVHLETDLGQQHPTGCPVQRPRLNGCNVHGVWDLQRLHRRSWSRQAISSWNWPFLGENHGKTLGKPQENHGKIWRFYPLIMTVTLCYWSHGQCSIVDFPTMVILTAMSIYQRLFVIRTKHLYFGNLNQLAKYVRLFQRHMLLYWIVSGPSFKPWKIDRLLCWVHRQPLGGRECRLNGQSIISIYQNYFIETVAIISAFAF